jgi:hypothetical protein
MRDDPDPFDQFAAPPAGEHVLDELRDFLGRFVAYPIPEALTAHTLWIAHTHAMEAWESTPRIAFLSTEPGSGKTRALEATEPLVPRPILAVNVTSAYLFRCVADEAGRPTILFDEIDTVFGPKAKDNEDIRGLFNAGHRRSGIAGRCVVKGKQIETEELPAYSALAMAGLGNLPDTILARSVIIRMRRRAPGETVEPWRRRLHVPQGEAIRELLQAWMQSAELRLSSTFPKPPPSVTDRDADVWEPLLAIADEAGGEWPELARVAAVTLVTQSKESTPSLGVKLLADLKTIFDASRDEHLPTQGILESLHNLEESPWGDLKGKPLNDRGLAQRLRGYEVKPTTLRTATGVKKGYRRSDFFDPWSRYLRPPANEPVTSVTTGTGGEAAYHGPTW